MAALGCSTATTQIGQLCAARDNIRVAGYQAITQQAPVNVRSQSCSVSARMRSRAAITKEGFNQAYQYNSTWGRGNSTRRSGRLLSFGSQSRGWWGNLLQGLQIMRPSANAFNNFGEDVRVDRRAREPVQWLEVPAAAKAAEDQTLSLVKVQKAGQVANVAEKAVDRGSTVATSALDKVGDALRTTGLEINLVVGLKELTIKELGLKDLGLVLEVKTKPTRPAQAEQTDKGGNNNTAA